MTTTTSTAPSTSSPRKKAAPPSAPHKAATPAPQKKAGKTPRSTPAPQPVQARTAKEKVRKVKRVRDSFVMPRDEHAVLATLKERSAGLGRPSKKSELLRAGLKLLAALNDKALLAALQALPAKAKGG
ncbi:MAG: hypothetical protein VW475_07095 [Curvibacter sp.]